MFKVTVGDKEVVVRGEDKQWSIGSMKKQKNKDGKMVTVFVGESFYSSTEGMIKALLEMKLRAADASSLTTLQLALKQAKDELKGLYDTAI